VALRGAHTSFGDRVARAYQQHSPAAIRFAVVITGDDETAGDLVQDAFVRVMARFGKGSEEPRVLEAYLREVILNLWRSRLRRRQLERRHLKAAAAETSQSHDLDTRELFWQALMKLPLRQRTALYLRYYLDLPVAEIAHELRCSEGAARSLLLHGLRKLRDNQEVLNGIQA